MIMLLQTKPCKKKDIMFWEDNWITTASKQNISRREIKGRLRKRGDETALILRLFLFQVSL